ncbi:MAG TPA: amidohydrolase, partial [Actinomycetota bacterium]|nr:amidohydrolase [Actinomycetota bacterium]
MPDRTLIRNGVVLPMEGRRAAFDPGSVLIDGVAIAAVGPVEEVDRLAEGAEVVDATGHAVIPGLQNGHLHSGLLRGTAEGK